MVANPKQMDEYVQEHIETFLAVAAGKKGKLDDSLRLKFLPVVQYYYEENDFEPAWSSMEKWKQPANTLLEYLDTADRDGLFKEDYHYSKLVALNEVLRKDSLRRMDAVSWAKAELLFTDAFMHLLQDLKQGRLQPDSMGWKYNEGRRKKFFLPQFNRLMNGESISEITTALQPSHTGYKELKKAIPGFIDSMDNNVYTYLVYPFKDSLAFIKQLKKRLAESKIILDPEAPLDTLMLQSAIKNYQARKGIKADGKIGSVLIKNLNSTGREKLKRIAITLDRYKQLPDSMPEKYIWVNLPGFYLKLWDADSMVMETRIICGKPATPTPSITSAITDIIIYPTWTVPTSIVSKEMLPNLKKDPGYLARKGLSLLKYNGDEVDPYTVNWAKYSKGIPYLIRQGSGDANALGVIKFNFSNPYAVYLHDTNQRYLFKNSNRSLSHGCVRVQDWQKLAFYLVRNDSLNAKEPDSLYYNTDSINNWIAAKERHRIDVKSRFPLFIRYFGCELVKGSIKFYDDIYGEDRTMREKYFSTK